MIVELMQKGLSFAGKVCAAFLGFLLYPLMGLARVWRATMGIAVIMALAIPLASLYLGYSVYHHNMGGLFSAFATTLMAAGATTGLAIGILPITAFLWTAYTVLSYPFLGWSIGWNEGVSPLFESPYNRELRLNPNPNQNVLFEFIGQPQRGMSMEDVLQRLGEAAVRAAQRPIKENEFIDLELSCAELEKIIDARQIPLTPEEIADLQGSDLLTQRLLAQYENIQRLKDDSCVILQSRPDPENTILLMKQYFRNGEWVPVPGVSHIFDREALKEAMKTNGVHPTVSSSPNSPHRDRILTPGKYTIGAEEFTTRYRYHDYYPCCDQEHGVSQEENQLLVLLRKRLELELASQQEGMPHNIKEVDPIPADKLSATYAR